MEKTLQISILVLIISAMFMFSGFQNHYQNIDMKNKIEGPAIYANTLELSDTPSTPEDATFPEYINPAVLDYEDKKESLVNYILGMVSGDSPGLHVEMWPKSVLTGDKFYISISPSEKGVYNNIYIYSPSNSYKKRLKIECNGYKCADEKEVSFTVPGNWESGNYYFKLYDYSESDYSKRWKKYYFNVTGGTEHRNLSVNLKPTSASTGQKININVSSGSDGVYRRAYIYSPTNRYLTYIEFPCSSVCYGDFTSEFKIPRRWASGNYYIKIYDYSESDYSKRWKTYNFNILKGHYNSDFYVNLNTNNLKNGEFVSAYISPSSQGVYGRVYFYSSYNYLSYADLNCSSLKCYDPINLSFQVPYSWKSGKYTMKVYDYSENDYSARWKKYDFNVI